MWRTFESCGELRLILIMLVGLVAWTATTGNLAAAADRPSVPTAGKIRVRVVDAKGKAMPNAKILASVWTKVPKEEFAHNRDYTSDAQGEVIVELPKTLEILRLWASTAGHVPLFTQVFPNTDAQPIPDTFTFELILGTTMGGIVKNEDGQPIAGAVVEIRLSSSAADKSRRVNPSVQSTKITDAEGHWSIDTIPPGDDVEVSLKLGHRDYTGDANWGELQREQGITSAALRAQTAAIVMHRGTSVTGRVTDPAGQPVAKAVVIWGDRPYWQPGSQEVYTDENGFYRFDPLPTGPVLVTVVAEGWMPDSRKVDVKPRMPAADFALKPGKKLRLKFVDKSGVALKDVSVSVSKWRGVESLYNHKHPNVVDTHIPRQTDGDGIYEWTWAPEDPVEYRFYTAGFVAATTSIAADDTEQTQTLYGSMKIVGTVVDAVSGRPITDFTTVPIIHFTPEFPHMERQRAQRQQSSTFQVEFDRTDVEHGVQIEAPGYGAYRTEKRYRIGEPNVTLEVRLQPIEPHISRVVDSQQHAIEGAKVYVATWFQSLYLNNLADRDGTYSSNYHVTTGAQGAFEINPPNERYTLIVVAPDGYAQTDREAGQVPGEIRIARWASLSGRLIQDGKPVVGSQVYVRPIGYIRQGEPQIHALLYATTGADGAFAFERVPPMPCYVEPHLHWSVSSRLTSSQAAPLALEPGEKRTVELGAKGIEVTGQLVLDPPREPFDFHFSLTYLVARRPGIEPPPALAAKGFDWHAGWSDSWRNSQEGGAYLKTLHHWFVKPDPDGKIRISGVEPGDYELAISLYGSTEGCLVHPQAARVMRFSIGADQTALDLGKVVVSAMTVPKVGDLALGFAIDAPDGHKLQLADLRGKFVLIDFWATWCGPCVAKLDEVERLRLEPGTSDRLVIVGANLDGDKEQAHKFLTAKNLPWHHALLGEWSSTDVPSRFGVSSVPFYVLVDPEGRILAQEFQFEAVAAKLKTALAGVTPR